MNHKELIDLVFTGTMEEDNRNFSIKVAVDSAKALLEILELHSPDYDEVNGYVCGQCSEGEYWIPYPCKTVESIEKALV